MKPRLWRRPEVDRARLVALEQPLPLMATETGMAVAAEDRVGLVARSPKISSRILAPFGSCYRRYQVAPHPPMELVGVVAVSVDLVALALPRLISSSPMLSRRPPSTLSAF